MAKPPKSARRAKATYEERGPSSGSRRAVVAGLLTLAILAVGLPVLVRALGGGEQLRALVEGAGHWAPLAYVAAKAATSLVAPLAGTPLKAVAGTLFGLWDGIAYSVLGDVLGGCASFWISRSLGRRAVVRFLGEGSVHRVDELSGRLGEWRALLLARLLLSSVYNLVSFAAGLTRLPFWQYFGVTTLGGVFHTGFLVALGASATLDRWAFLAAYAALAVLALLAVLARRRLRRHAGGRLGIEEPESDLPEKDDRQYPGAEKRMKGPGGHS